MSNSLYSAIGSTFGKLLKAKAKPIILAKTVNQDSVPFLHGFKSGTTLLRPLEESYIEELTEDIFETIYTLSLQHRGVNYIVVISESKDVWIIKDVRVAATDGSPDKRKKNRLLSLPFVLLLAISAIGYMYQFGLFGTKGSSSNSNPSVYEAFAGKAAEQPADAANAVKPVEPEKNPDQKTVAESLKQPESSPTSTSSTGSTQPTQPSGQKQAATVPPTWEQQKAELEKQIASLKQENETLKKQLGQKPSAIPFVIKQGEKPADIAKAAQAAGIVTNSGDFYQALVASKAGPYLVPGSYLIQRGTSYNALIEQLTMGAVKIK